MAHFQSQNRKIENGTINGIHVKHLNLDTLGLSNSCIDSKIEGPFYPEMAFNNTYGFQAIPENVYHEAKNNITKEGGCNDLIEQCHSMAISDPENVGTNDTINAACALASEYCYKYVQGAYVAISGVRTTTLLLLRLIDMVSGVPLTYLGKQPRSSHLDTSLDT
jgi:hypothetical protein